MQVKHLLFQATGVITPKKLSRFACQPYCSLFLLTFYILQCSFLFDNTYQLCTKFLYVPNIYFEPNFSVGLFMWSFVVVLMYMPVTWFSLWNAFLAFLFLEAGVLLTYICFLLLPAQNDRLLLRCQLQMELNVFGLVKIHCLQHLPSQPWYVKELGKM